MKLKQTNKLKTVIVSEENISYTIRKAEKSESNKLTNQNFTENVAVFSLLNTILLFITKKKLVVAVFSVTSPFYLQSINLDSQVVDAVVITVFSCFVYFLVKFFNY